MAKAKIDNVYMSHGLTKFEVPEGVAGDIVQLTGVTEAQIGETIADADKPEALPIMEVEAPTLKIYLGPNTSPMKGTEGEFTTSRQIGERLQRELETNVGLRVEENGIGFLVSGRGELHLSVLIESMRREGYEFEVSKPEAITKMIGGKMQEPYEQLVVDTVEEFIGPISESLSSRLAQMTNMYNDGSGNIRME